jgi:hypothetical protein
MSAAADGGPAEKTKPLIIHGPARDCFKFDE